MKMRVLPSTHAFVFGAQQRPFIGLPRLHQACLEGGYHFSFFPKVEHGALVATPTLPRIRTQ
jgi:hypothetical protein